MSRTGEFIRGATLIHGPGRALCRIPSYPSQLTYASRHGILGEAPLLIHALSGPFDVLPGTGFQLIPLSVTAHTPLSPRQRFIWFIQFLCLTIKGGEELVNKALLSACPVIYPHFATTVNSKSKPSKSFIKVSILGICFSLSSREIDC